MANHENELARQLRRTYSPRPDSDSPKNPLAANPATSDEIRRHLRSVRGSEVVGSEVTASHLLRAILTPPIEPFSDQDFDQAELVTEGNEELLEEKLALDPEKSTLGLSRVVFYDSERDHAKTVLEREDYKKKELVKAMLKFVGWTWTEEETRAVLFPKGHSDWEKISNLIKTLAFIRSLQPESDKFEFNVSVPCIDEHGFLIYDGELHRFPAGFKLDKSCQVLLTLVWKFQELEKKVKKSSHGKNYVKRTKRFKSRYTKE